MKPDKLDKRLDMESSPTPRETSPQSYSPMVVINDNKKCSQKNVNGDQVKVEEDKENIHRSNGFGEKRNNIEKIIERSKKLNRKEREQIEKAIMKVKVSDQGVMARSTSLENLPNCILEEIKEREEKTRSSNDIHHQMSNLSSWGLSRSYNDSSVVRQIDFHGLLDSQH